MLAKPVRSTLDTKEGYQTKTGSTSLATRTLIMIKYWDQDGAERNRRNEVHTGKWMTAAQLGLKMSCIHPCGHPIQPRSFLENRGFDPVLMDLWFQIGPFSSPFWPREGPKLHNMGSFHLLVHSKKSKNRFGKTHF